MPTECTENTETTEREDTPVDRNPPSATQQSEPFQQCNCSDWSRGCDRCTDAGRSAGRFVRVQSHLCALCALRGKCTSQLLQPQSAQRPQRRARLPCTKQRPKSFPSFVALNGRGLGW